MALHDALKALALRCSGYFDFIAFGKRRDSDLVAHFHIGNAVLFGAILAHKTKVAELFEGAPLRLFDALRKLGTKTDLHRLIPVALFGAHQGDGDRSGGKQRSGSTLPVVGEVLRHFLFGR